MKTSRQEAFDIAFEHVHKGLTTYLSEAVELSNGWFFPWISEDGQVYLGSNGIIVSKETGECLELGSAFAVERDLQFYEAGYTRSAYDIRISRVHDEALTLDLLEDLGISVVEPEEAHGVTWKIPRSLSRSELSARLSELPCAFQNVSVYFRIEAIERAMATGCCELQLLPPSNSN